MEAYRRSRAYRLNPRATVAQYSAETQLAREEIEAAREMLPGVELPPDVLEAGTWLIQHMGIDSLRAEITLFEAARAYAAADGRSLVNLADLVQVAPMTLRLRQSTFMIQYFQDQKGQEEQIKAILDQIAPGQKTPINREETSHAE